MTVEIRGDAVDLIANAMLVLMLLGGTWYVRKKSNANAIRDIEAMHTRLREADRRADEEEVDEGDEWKYR
jgi:uncharacterized membrane protein